MKYKLKIRTLFITLITILVLAALGGCQNQSGNSAAGTISLTESAQSAESSPTAKVTSETTVTPTAKVTSETTVTPTALVSVTDAAEPATANDGSSESDTKEGNTPVEQEDIDFASMTAMEFVSGFSLGWNLGNTMDATGGNKQTVSSQETSWGNPVTTLELMTTLKENGFSIVRIPITWDAFTGDGPDYKISDDFMNRVKEIVDYCYENDLYVIINMHHEEWYDPYVENEAAATEKLTVMWAQIADAFQDYDEHLIFECMNEPRLRNTASEWNGGTAEARAVINRINAAFVTTIREASGKNKTRFLMLPGYAASGEATVLNDIVLPDDDRLIVSVHAYTPYNFALNKSGTSTWDASSAADTRDIDNLMSRLNEKFISQGIPVIIGEFGAMNKDNDEDRAAWAAYYTGKAAQLGVPCIWWDNGAFSGSGELFGLVSRTTYKVRYQNILDNMISAMEITK